MSWNMPASCQVPTSKMEEPSEGEAASKSKHGKYNRKNNKPNPLISRTEKCRVCDEPAAIHVHYGAITCFSCRAFFRRSIQNHSSEAYRCRKDNNCDISLKSRKSCQKCRFDKCLQIGMKSNWVLSEEERYHRFRKHRERSEPNAIHASAHDNDQEMDRNSNRSSPEMGDTSSPLSSQGFGGGDSDSDHTYYPCCWGSGGSQGTSTAISLPHYPSFTPNSQMEDQSDYDFDPLPVFSGSGMDFTNHGTTGLSTRSESFPINLDFDDSLLPQRLRQHRVMAEPLNLKIETSEPCTSMKRIENPCFHSAQMFDDMGMDEDMHQDDLANRSPLGLLYSGYVPGVTVDELSQIQAISQLHDFNYKSISFGEQLIKEMVMSSVFKVPLSPSATMSAYRLMIQRVTRVAQGLDSFINLPYKIQSMLLKQNADLIVSLRGAVFFEKRKGGLDQILISMGVDDLVAAMSMVSSAVKTMSLQRIDYSTFNSLQKVGNTESEKRYNELLEHVGVTVSFDMTLVKILSYILLFSVHCDNKGHQEWQEVENLHELMIGMMQRYISAKYPQPTSSKIFSGVLKCIAELHELTWIKKQRQLASHASAKVSEDCSLLTTEPNKSLHFSP